VSARSLSAGVPKALMDSEGHAPLTRISRQVANGLRVTLRQMVGQEDRRKAAAACGLRDKEALALKDAFGLER